MITSIEFLALVEQGIVEATPAGTNWEFQRVVNLAGQSGSLEIRPKGTDESDVVATIQVRAAGGSQEPLQQGWIKLQGVEGRAHFAISDSAGLQGREKIQSLAAGWVSEIMRVAEPAGAKRSEAEASLKEAEVVRRLRSRTKRLIS